MGVLCKEGFVNVGGSKNMERVCCQQEATVRNKKTIRTTLQDLNMYNMGDGGRITLWRESTRNQRHPTLCQICSLSWMLNTNDYCVIIGSVLVVINVSWRMVGDDCHNFFSKFPLCNNSSPCFVVAKITF